MLLSPFTTNHPLTQCPFHLPVIAKNIVPIVACDAHSQIYVQIQVLFSRPPIRASGPMALVWGQTICRNFVLLSGHWDEARSPNQSFLLTSGRCDEARDPIRASSYPQDIMMRPDPPIELILALRTLGWGQIPKSALPPALRTLWWGQRPHQSFLLPSGHHYKARPPNQSFLLPSGCCDEVGWVPMRASPYTQYIMMRPDSPIRASSCPQDIGMRPDPLSELPPAVVALAWGQTLWQSFLLPSGHWDETRPPIKASSLEMDL
jgi:hypothetical protein